MIRGDDGGSLQLRFSFVTIQFQENSLYTLNLAGVAPPCPGTWMILNRSIFDEFKWQRVACWGG